MMIWPADVALALNYAGPEMTALMRFDRILGSTIAGAREPAMAQLRLAWWRTQLDGPIAGNEGYDAIKLFGGRLLPVIDGWEQLLAPLPLNEDALHAYGGGAGHDLRAAWRRRALGHGLGARRFRPPLFRPDDARPRPRHGNKGVTRSGTPAEATARPHPPRAGRYI